MLDICLLGTGGMIPLKNRWLTSCYIMYNGKAVLIDCGEGTQIALAEHGCKISCIDVLLITHCHADHISGLPGFLLSLGNTSRTRPLDIYLPESCCEMVGKLLCICENLPFEIVLHGLCAQRETKLSCDKIDSLLEISSIPLKHSTDCFGWSLIFRRKPVFLPDRAKSLGIPVNMWKQLHNGGSVTIENGSVVDSKDVTLNSRRPVKIVYITDTLPFDGIAEAAYGADLMICEGMYGDYGKKESMNQKGHMLMQDACFLAKAAEVKRLWLTHYSPAMKDPWVYENELCKIFENTVISADGQRISI